MYYYYVTTQYHCHDMEMGEPELYGPFDSEEARAAEVERKRHDVDDWNLEEDTIVLLYLQSSELITDTGSEAPVAPAYEGYDDEENDDEDDEEGLTEVLEGESDEDE